MYRLAIFLKQGIFSSAAYYGDLNKINYVLETINKIIPESKDEVILSLLRKDHYAIIADCAQLARSAVLYMLVPYLSEEHLEEMLCAKNFWVFQFCMIVTESDWEHKKEFVNFLVDNLQKLNPAKALEMVATTESVGINVLVEKNEIEQLRPSVPATVRQK